MERVMIPLDSVGFAGSGKRNVTLLSHVPTSVSRTLCSGPRWTGGILGFSCFLSAPVSGASVIDRARIAIDRISVRCMGTPRLGNLGESKLQCRQLRCCLIQGLNLLCDRAGEAEIRLGDR